MRNVPELGDGKREGSRPLSGLWRHTGCIDRNADPN